jgi:hypothetical protein
MIADLWWVPSFVPVFAILAAGAWFYAHWSDRQQQNLQNKVLADETRRRQAKELTKKATRLDVERQIGAEPVPSLRSNPSPPPDPQLRRMSMAERDRLVTLRRDIGEKALRADLAAVKSGKLRVKDPVGFQARLEKDLADLAHLEELLALEREPRRGVCDPGDT